MTTDPVIKRVREQIPHMRLTAGGMVDVFIQLNDANKRRVMRMALQLLEDEKEEAEEQRSTLSLV